MLILLPLLMGLILLHPGTAMDAAGAACRLFVQSVLPGLFPYMVLSLMLVSRTGGIMPGWLVMVLGWCGGSPTGARLLHQQHRRDRRLAVSCTTMSPMFLAGTLGQWLNSPLAGSCILTAVLLGGWLTGRFLPPAADWKPSIPQPMSFGQAVAAAAETMLLVCGSMAVLRTLAALTSELTDAWLPALSLPVTTLLEVTTGIRLLSQLPLPLPLRTAWIAGAAGFGGMALLLQCRACLPEGMFSLPQQVAWQVLHGAVSFTLALGLMLMLS